MGSGAVTTRPHRENGPAGWAECTRAPEPPAPAGSGPCPRLASRPPHSPQPPQPECQLAGPSSAVPHAHPCCEPLRSARVLARGSALCPRGSALRPRAGPWPCAPPACWPVPRHVAPGGVSGVPELWLHQDEPAGGRGDHRGGPSPRGDAVPCCLHHPWTLSGWSDPQGPLM